MQAETKWGRGYMRKVSVKDLVPGMTTAEDVYTFNNQLVLPKGIVLNDKSITKLEFYSILSIRVEDGETAEVEKQQDLSYSERLMNSDAYRAFVQHFDEELADFTNEMNAIVRENAPIEPEVLLHHALNLLEDDMGFPNNVFTMLQNMRQYDDQTHAHCMNVALICNVFARWMRMSKEDIELATMCGMLHDVGKLAIPDSILRKPSKLTGDEYSVVKTHCLEGYNILKQHPIDPHIMNAALMHHERWDGSGYPLGVSGAKIDKFARMVAIADVYDAMTSARVYRGPLCPFVVIDIFESEGLQKYDPDFYMTFMNNVVTTYLLNRVRLSNGAEGDIIFINPSHPARPTVKVGDEFIDLAMRKDLSIEAII